MSLSLNVIITKVVNFLKQRTNTQSLTAIQTVAERDYALVMSKASAALHAAQTEITTLATTEYQTLLTAAAALAKRAEALAATNVLTAIENDIAAVKAHFTSASTAAPVVTATPPQG